MRRPLAIASLLSFVVAAATAAATAGACTGFDADPSAADDGGSGDDASPATLDGPAGDVVTGTCTATTDLSSDPAHCGRCNHGCLGGGCMGGVCQPIVLATTSDAPIVTMTVDETRVLWTSSTDYIQQSSVLHACPKTGCGSPASLVTAPLGNVASDGTKALVTFLYSQRKLSEVRTDGTLVQIAAFGNTYGNLEWLLPAGTSWYAIDDATDDAGAQRLLVRWPGGEAGPSVVGLTGAPEIFNIGHTVATSLRLHFGPRNDAHMRTCELPDCTTLTKFLDTDEGTAVQAMAATPDRVWWTRYNAVLSCADGETCAGAVTELDPTALDGGAPTTIAAHDTHVFVGTDRGDVWDCLASSCRATVRRVAHVPNGLDVRFLTSGRLLVADENAIYFAALGGAPDADAGSERLIVKVARP